MIGKSKFGFVQEGISYYKSQIEHFCEIEVVELRDHGSDREKEMQEFEKYFAAKKRGAGGKVQCMLWDETGKQLTSVEFSQNIKREQDQGANHLFFLVGGAYGFTPEFKKTYPQWLAISSMTFPHDFVRIMILEQIYRALHILSGGKYHHS